MNFLFLFLDGVGLGSDSSANPFSVVPMPNLEKIINGHRLTRNQLRLPITTERATLMALDACMGVDGRPQSASGQASLITGKNIPKIIGQHYGPKPNSEIRLILENDNLFSKLKKSGYQSSFLNAFPEGYFEMINSGRRLPGVFSMAARIAGIRLKNTDDLFAEEAVSADFTAKGWREHLGFLDTPILNPQQAGVRLAQLAKRHDFSLFEYWLSDYAGHKRNVVAAHDLLKIFDQVLGGLLSEWDDETGLILITSDHGNLEDLTIRNHTRNPVPAILVGAPILRQKFTQHLKDLSDIYPAIIQFLDDSS